MINVVDSILEIAAQLDRQGNALNWYVFGSYLTCTTTAKDIDILILYDGIDSAKIAREYLEELAIIYPIDILLMTKGEELQFNFIESQGAKKIYPDHGLPPKPSR